MCWYVVMQKDVRATVSNTLVFMWNSKLYLAFQEDLLTSSEKNPDRGFTDIAKSFNYFYLRYRRSRYFCVSCLKASMTLTTGYLSDPIEVSVLSSPTAPFCPPPDELLVRATKNKTWKTEASQRLPDDLSLHIEDTGPSNQFNRI